MKRILIFCFYDKEGIVDGYVSYLLQQMKKFVDRIIIVSNCELRAEEKEKFEPFSSEIIVRENQGYDAAAWREIMVGYCGWKQLDDYDEVILMNDTVYGPLCDLTGVFECEKEYDVWGITSHGGFDDGKVSYPAHIQSYFMVYKKKVVQNQAFQAYWESMPVYQDVNELIMKHEVRFTQFLVDQGFSWHVYCDMQKYETNADENVIHYFYNQYGLMQEAKCPFAKKKLFVWQREDSLLHGDGGNAKRSYEWIRENSEYDTSLIVKNLLRTERWEKVKGALGLQYIVTDLEMKAAERKAALCILGNEQAEMQKYLPLLRELERDGLPVLIAESHEHKAICEKIYAEVPESVEYLCIYQVAKAEKCRFYTSVLDEQRMIWNNMVSNINYVNGIVNLFENDRNLGALVSSFPFWPDYRLFGDQGMPKVFWIKKELLKTGIEYSEKKEKFAEFSDNLARVGYLIGEIQNRKDAENRLAAYEYMICNLQEENRIARNLPLRIKRFVQAKLLW